MKNKKMLIVIALIVVVALVAVFIPKTSQSATKNKQVKIGILQFVTHPALDAITKGAEDELKKEGFSNAKINFYNGEADQSKLQTMAGQLNSENNDVLIGVATPAVQALANATSKTPIVMGAVTDPVGANLIKNVNTPEGNITGVSDRFPFVKEIKLMKEIMPNLKTVGVLYTSSEANSKSQVEGFTKVAKENGLTVKAYAIASSNDITNTLTVASKEVQAFYVGNDNTIASAFNNVLQITNAAKIPVFPSVDTMVEQGGLAAVSINQRELGIQTGKIAAEILKGKKVSSIPVDFYDHTTPVVNTKTAKALGITIPQSVLSVATTK
ncbi:tryptophan ABC transporter substrate-binding protein [Lactococcus sp.]|uniref:tryptophan ABC transporter substrate-binding protein n=1 Tax=Lactococcus sp. TaxID=44273 RepID=UPI0035B4C0A1